MGKQSLEDMTVRPMSTVLTSLTPGAVTSGRSAGQLGMIPVGYYRGQASFWDLDKAVVQPLVSAEKQHILGVLDGREADYDLLEIAVPLADPIDTVHIGSIPVPAGQVWYVTAVETVVPAGTGIGNEIAANWRCSLWADRIGSSVAGQTFHAADLNFGPGGGTQVDEFGEFAMTLGLTNKPVALRLPPGATITGVFTNLLAVNGVAVNGIIRVYGYIGKILAQ